MRVRCDHLDQVAHNLASGDFKGLRSRVNRGSLRLNLRVVAAIKQQLVRDESQVHAHRQRHRQQCHPYHRSPVPRPALFHRNPVLFRMIFII